MLPVGGDGKIYIVYICICRPTCTSMLLFQSYLSEDDIFHSTHDGDGDPVHFILGRKMIMPGETS